MSIKKNIFTLLRQSGLVYLLRNFKGEGVTVLSLHRISEETNFFFDPIKPAVFNKLVQYCIKYYDIVTFSSIHSTTKKPKLILSFDDGYADFMEYAIPILSKFNVPCNHNFVNSCLNNNQIIWTQKLCDIFSHLKQHQITNNADIAKHGVAFDGNWWVYYLAFFRKMLKIEAEEKNALLVKLSGEYNINSNYKMMNWDDLITCVNQYGVEVGCHTYNHESLLNIQKQADLDSHIGNALIELEEKIKKPIQILSLPNGQYNSAVIDYAKQKNIKYILLSNDKINKLNDLKSNSNLVNRIYLLNENVDQMILRAELFQGRIKSVRP